MEKSKEGDCCGLYEAINFRSSPLLGVSGGSPIGGTYNNQEIFEDRYDKPDVTRVRGGAVVLSGSMAFGKHGVSGGGYRFGELYGTNRRPSGAEGYDLGVDYVGDRTWLVGSVYCVESPFFGQH